MSGEDVFDLPRPIATMACSNCGAVMDEAEFGIDESGDPTVLYWDDACPSCGGLLAAAEGDGQ